MRFAFQANIYSTDTVKKNKFVNAVRPVIDGKAKFEDQIFREQTDHNGVTYTLADYVFTGQADGVEVFSAVVKECMNQGFVAPTTVSLKVVDTLGNVINDLHWDAP